MIAEPPDGEIKIAQRVYYGPTTDFTGFYDWLRSGAEEIIGVRYWPFDDYDFVYDVAKVLPYAKVEQGRFVEIFFTDRRDFKPELSGDQDFGHNQILTSEDDEYALTFGIQESLSSSLRI